MPFRSDEPTASVYTPSDTLARFSDIHTALDSERGWLGDRVPLRMAAVCLITTPGEAGALAAATRQVGPRDRRGRRAALTIPLSADSTPYR